VFRAELGHAANTFDGHLRAARTGSIVQAAMHDAAVVRALMHSHSGFFLKDGDVYAWGAFQQTVSGS